MRIGENPQRDKKVQLGTYFHQIIMPVYIPHLEDYYQESFEIFKLSIESLLITSHADTFITVVANGCCKEVVDYISEMFKMQKIHELIITTAIGKLNSVLKGLAGSVYPLVTITDADVLFLNSWQKNTYLIFNEFPNTGVVSPVPNPSLSYYKTSNLMRDTFFSDKVKYEEVLNKEALLKFGRSVGNEIVFKEKYSNKCLALISQNNIKAVVGAGHFVATYNSAVFDYNFERSTKYLLGGDSEIELLDKRVLALNQYRLSTQDNYAYHLGNTLQNWMNDEITRLTKEQGVYTCPRLEDVKKGSYAANIYNRITNRIFDSLMFKKYFLEKKNNK